MSKVKLAVQLGGLKLKNPVLTASGTFGYGLEYATYVDLNALGGVIVKGTTLEPREGNPPPRVVETPAGMLNAIGLQNPGVEEVINCILPRLENFDTAIIVNIAGNTVDEYAEIARRLDRVKTIAALEVNISCPNVKKGGMAFGVDPVLAAEVVAAVRANTSLPVIAKLSPNVTDPVAIAEACVAAGADVLSMINTLLGMAIDINSRRPVLANIFGGLSGPAI
ncbi:dihydroorotate dehydrogenase, partial [Calderihabitans maritimus]